MAKLILTRDNQTLKTLFLTGTRTWIGSAPGCDIRIDGEHVEARLASILRRDNHFVLTSRNRGRLLQINHGHVASHLLQHGDVIHLGPYRLLFSDSRRDDPPLARTGKRKTACLKVLGGRSRGRVIRLNGPVTRFGRTGATEVMISRRRDGYYLSLLEGNDYPRVNHAPIGEDPHPLNDGDTIEIDGNRFEFRSTADAAYRDRSECAAAAGMRQRHFTRVALQIPAILCTAGRRWDTHLIDLSLNGALVAHPAGWTGMAGERHSLELQLNSQSGLTLQTEISQVTGQRIGMSFVDMNTEAREEIRWLVKINLADSSLLERELSELL